MKNNMYDVIFMIKEHPIKKIITEFNEKLYLNRYYEKNKYTIRLSLITLHIISIFLGIYYHSYLLFLIASLISQILIVFIVELLKKFKKSILNNSTFYNQKKDLLKQLFQKYEINNKNKVTVLKEHLNSLDSSNHNKYLYINMIYILSLIILFLYFPVANSNLAIILISAITMFSYPIQQYCQSLSKYEEECAKIMLQTIQLVEYENILKIEKSREIV